LQREKKLRALRRVLGDEQIKKANEVVFFCPRKECIDYVTKFNAPKLSVNLETDCFHCWVCEYKGRTLVPLLRMKGNTPELQEYLDELDTSKGPHVVEEKQYDVPVLPEEFRTLSHEWNSPYYKCAMKYLSSRGVYERDIVRMKLGYCESGEYKYRIIVPSFDEFGELNFFSGRLFYGTNPLRYLHGNFCKDIVYNDYLIDWNKPIVLTEGPFDVIKAGENAIALQGNIINENRKLFRKIVTNGVDVYFAMDTDAFKKQLEIIELFMSYGVESYYVNLFGKKDVGSMSNAEFLAAKKKAIKVKTGFDLLKIRIMA